MGKEIFDRNQIVAGAAKWLGGSKYNPDNLVKAIKDIVLKYTGDADALMFDNTKKCKAYALTFLFSSRDYFLT
jgi:hypothetical protein